MRWLLDRVRGRGGRASSTEGLPFATAEQLDQTVEHTKVAVKCAYSFGWQVRDWHFDLVQHSARVALLARWVGERLQLEDEDIETLAHAAQLHEIGMIAVPGSLVSAERDLTPEELERVRGHARIGAEIVRASYEGLRGDLVEHQYADYVELYHHFPEDPVARQLAGILRVADVYDTLVYPRAYQRNIPAGRWREVLHAGTGKQFYPEAAAAILMLLPENRELSELGLSDGPAS